MKPHAALGAATLAGVILGVGNPSAQTPGDTPPTVWPATATAGGAARPFSRLFVQPAVDRAAGLRVRDTRPNSARRFICGSDAATTTPAVDARFGIQPPGRRTLSPMLTVWTVCR
jgi:hypothetical protein